MGRPSRSTDGPVVHGGRLLLVLLLLLLGGGELCASTNAEKATMKNGGSGSGGSELHSDSTVEYQIIMSLAILGGVLVAVAIAMMSASEDAMLWTEEIGDHARGAVDALLDRSEAQERRLSLSKTELSELQEVRAKLLDNFPPYDPDDLDARVAEQHKIDDFFYKRVSDDWLMDVLHNASHKIEGRVFEQKTKCPCCVGWKALWLRSIHVSTAQAREYKAMRGRLREYIREHLYIQGRLEPVWKKPAAEAVKRMGKSMVAIFDFCSDVLACHTMYVGVAEAARQAEQGLAVMAMLWLVFSTVLSTIGSCYFTFKATERVHSEAKPHRIADHEMLQRKPGKYCVVLFAAMTNPELLHHMAWRNRKALAEFGGLPTVQCALFCAIAAVVEDVPQLIIQLIYAHRTTGIENPGDLTWQLQVSIAMSIVSLLFRVLFRCFVAVLRKFQEKESRPIDAPSVPLYLKFDDPQRWGRSYTEMLTQQYRFLPINDKNMRRRQWRFCWIGYSAGQNLISKTTSTDSTSPAAALTLFSACGHGGFVYLDDCGDMLSFELLKPTRTKNCSENMFPEELGPLEVLRVGAKLVNALRLRGCPSEGVPGENSAYNNTDSVKLYKWELPAATVLAVEMDKESGEEHPILRTADAIVGFVSEVERITFNDEDRRRARVPTTATHFCWAYPSSEFDDEEFVVQQVAKVDTASPEFLFLKAGGFVYFQKEQQEDLVVVGANALGFQDKDVASDSEIKVALKRGDWDPARPTEGNISTGSVWVQSEKMRLFELREEISRRLLCSCHDYGDYDDLVLYQDSSTGMTEMTDEYKHLSECIVDGAEIIAVVHKGNEFEVDNVVDALSARLQKEHDELLGMDPVYLELLLEHKLKLSKSLREMLQQKLAEHANARMWDLVSDLSDASVLRKAVDTFRGRKDGTNTKEAYANLERSEHFCRTIANRIIRTEPGTGSFRPLRRSFSTAVELDPVRDRDLDLDRNRDRDHQPVPKLEPEPEPVPEPEPPMGEAGAGAGAEPDPDLDPETTVSTVVVKETADPDDMVEHREITRDHLVAMAEAINLDDELLDSMVDACDGDLQSTAGMLQEQGAPDPWAAFEVKRAQAGTAQLDAQNATSLATAMSRNVDADRPKVADERAEDDIKDLVRGLTPRLLASDHEDDGAQDLAQARVHAEVEAQSAQEPEQEAEPEPEPEPEPAQMKVLQSVVHAAKHARWSEVHQQLFSANDAVCALPNDMINSVPKDRSYGLLHQLAYHGAFNEYRALVDQGVIFDGTVLTDAGQTAAEVATEHGFDDFAAILGALPAVPRAIDEQVTLPRAAMKSHDGRTHVANGEVVTVLRQEAEFAWVRTHGGVEGYLKLIHLFPRGTATVQRNDAKAETLLRSAATRTDSREGDNWVHGRTAVANGEVVTVLRREAEFAWIRTHGGVEGCLKLIHLLPLGTAVLHNWVDGKTSVDSVVLRSEGWGLMCPISRKTHTVSSQMFGSSHAMGRDERANNFCDDCKSKGIRKLGTSFRCQMGCDYDICQSCADEARQGPAAKCCKQKPRLKIAWPDRFVAIAGKRLSFYADQDDQRPRGSSIKDVTGCIVTPGLHKGNYLITLFRKDHADLPDLSEDGYVRFYFKEENERAVFVRALSNLAAGREWWDGPECHTEQSDEPFQRMSPNARRVSGASWPDVLCMAGAETTAVVQEVATSANLTVHSVTTNAEALQVLLRQKDLGGEKSCRALVAALGVDASNFLFNEGCGDKSDLISLAKQLGCAVVVYSHTAVRNNDTSRACMDVGADAVVASAADLQQQMDLFAMSDAVEAADLTPREMDASSTATSGSQSPAIVGSRLLPALPPGASDNSAAVSRADVEQMVQQVGQVTGLGEEDARRLLSSHGYVVESAVNAHMRSVAQQKYSPPRNSDSLRRMLSSEMSRPTTSAIQHHMESADFPRAILLLHKYGSTVGTHSARVVLAGVNRVCALGHEKSIRMGDGEMDIAPVQAIVDCAKAHMDHRRVVDRALVALSFVVGSQIHMEDAYAECAELVDHVKQHYPRDRKLLRKAQDVVTVVRP